MRLAIQNTLTNVAKDIKVDYGVTTQTWTKRPNVRIESPSDDERTISPDGDLYPMLEAGTKPHTIRPRRARVLRFQTPFRAKTVPNQIRSGAGSVGAGAVFARGVQHPGTAPRNWSKVIAAKWRKQVGAIFQRALEAAAR